MNHLRRSTLTTLSKYKRAFVQFLIKPPVFRLLLVPYYEADTLQRIMGNRLQRVELAQAFYLEYLKLMNHYKMLDKD